MYSSLTIENFRGISELELRDIGKFTLLTGFNGSGKTTVLEALFLLCGGGSAALTASLYGFRGDNMFSPQTDRPFRSLFRGLDVVDDPKLRPVIKAKSQWFSTGPFDLDTRLSISPMFSVAAGGATTNPKQSLNGVMFEFTGPSGSVRNTWCWETVAGVMPNGQNAMRLGGTNTVKNWIGANFISPYVQANNTEIHNSLTQLVTEKKIEQLVEVMRVMEPRLNALQPLQENGVQAIFADIGLDRLVHISLLGSGFSNFLRTAIAVVQMSRGCVLIDEFEDGLHYSVVRQLLDKLIGISEKKKIQFFITTHSKEFLSTFSELAIERKFDDVGLYRLSGGKRSGPLTKYTVSELDDLLESNMELR